MSDRTRIHEQSQLIGEKVPRLPIPKVYPYANQKHRHKKFLAFFILEGFPLKLGTFL